MKRIRLHTFFRRRQADEDDYDRAEDERLKAEALGSWGRTRDLVGMAAAGRATDDPRRH